MVKAHVRSVPCRRQTNTENVKTYYWVRAYIVLLLDPIRVRLQQHFHIFQRRVALLHRGDVKRQPPSLRTVGAEVLGAHARVVYWVHRSGTVSVARDRRGPRQLRG